MTIDCICHSGTTESFLKVLGHRPFRLATGDILHVLSNTEEMYI